MSFAVNVAPALPDLAKLRKFEARRILDAIEECLISRPNIEEGHKKLIRLKSGEVYWQLRVGDFRVFYQVDADAEAVTVLHVRKKGRKTTEEIL